MSHVRSTLPELWKQTLEVVSLEASEKEVEKQTQGLKTLDTRNFEKKNHSWINLNKLLFVVAHYTISGGIHLFIISNLNILFFIYIFDPERKKNVYVLVPFDKKTLISTEPVQSGLLLL